MKEVAEWSRKVFKFNSLHQNQNSPSEGLDLSQTVEAIRSLVGEKDVVEVFPCTLIASQGKQLSAFTRREWKFSWDANRTRVREQLFKIGIVSAQCQL